MKVDTAMAHDIEMLQEHIATIFRWSEWIFFFDRVTDRQQVFFLIYKNKPVGAIYFRDSFLRGENAMLTFIWDAYLRIIPAGDRVIDLNVDALHLATYPLLLENFFPDINLRDISIDVNWSTMMTHYAEELLKK